MSKSTQITNKEQKQNHRYCVDWFAARLILQHANNLAKCLYFNRSLIVVVDNSAYLRKFLQNNNDNTKLNCTKPKKQFHLPRDNPERQRLHEKNKQNKGKGKNVIARGKNEIVTPSMRAYWPTRRKATDCHRAGSSAAPAIERHKPATDRSNIRNISNKKKKKKKKK
jgi:hypothetical protein